MIRAITHACLPRSAGFHRRAARNHGRAHGGTARRVTRSISFVRDCLGGQGSRQRADRPSLAPLATVSAGAVRALSLSSGPVHRHIREP